MKVEGRQLRYDLGRFVHARLRRRSPVALSSDYDFQVVVENVRVSRMCAATLLNCSAELFQNDGGKAEQLSLP